MGAGGDEGELPEDSGKNEANERTSPAASTEEPSPDADADIDDDAGTAAASPTAEFSERLQNLLQNALQNPGVQLDPKTDSFDIPSNLLDVVFTPSIFPNERIWVYDEVAFSPTGRLGAHASDSKVRPMQNGLAQSSETVFFWVKIRLANPRAATILPTPAPGVRVEGLPPGVVLYENEKGMLFYKATSSAPVSMTLRMGAPRTYFEEPDLERVPVPPVRAFPGSDRLREISLRTFGKPDAGFLARMARYFRGFDVLRLRPFPATMSLEEAILKQKRGVCRHRALLFFGIASAWGYDVRLVLNRVHAFVEVRWAGHPWTRLDLGGAQLPPGFSPPTAPDLFSRIPYDYRIPAISAVRSGGILTVVVEHASEPPPFLWAIIRNASGREVARTGILPSSGRREILRIPLPPLPAGRYKVLLEPPVWRNPSP